METYKVTNKEIKKNFGHLLKPTAFNIFIREIVRRCAEKEGEEFVIKQFMLTKNIVDGILQSKRPVAVVKEVSDTKPTDDPNLPNAPKNFYEAAQSTPRDELCRMFNLTVYNVNQLLANTPINVGQPAPLPKPVGEFTQEIREAAIKKYGETRNFTETASALGIKDIFAIVRWVREHEKTKSSI